MCVAQGLEPIPDLGWTMERLQGYEPIMVLTQKHTQPHKTTLTANLERKVQRINHSHFLALEEENRVFKDYLTEAHEEKANTILKM